MIHFRVNREINTRGHGEFATRQQPGHDCNLKEYEMLETLERMGKRFRCIQHYSCRNREGKKTGVQKYCTI